ncbi:MAG: GntR family transcriptional regulator [Rubrivivax sp.]
MANQIEIAQRVVEAILSQKLAPGERLGEQELADMFGVSRTLVREALMQLQARGFVEVRTRKGWYVVEPSVDEARGAFAARRAVEAGMLRNVQLEGDGRPLQSVMRRLRGHVAEEQQAIEAADPATRAFLLADFHVCLAECLGHKLLSRMMRDLTARTMLAATLYQCTHDAQQSCAQHGEIVDALERGDIDGATKLMMVHIGQVEDAVVPKPDSSKPE